jgi:glycine cleavage system H protein
VTPDKLLYAKTHEWVNVEAGSAGEKIATVGLSAFALKLLTDLVFMELPPTGRQVKAGESFGEIESVKAVSDLYSPVDGQIVASNSAIVQNLQRLAEDPYGDGWLVKIRISDPAGLAQLMDFRAYEKQCAEEEAG